MPVPLKHHFYCQMCKTKFDDYFEHLNSVFHNNKKKEFKNEFDNIKNTFKRIGEFWENENKKKLKKFIQLKNEKENILFDKKIINNVNNNILFSTNLTTKFPFEINSIENNNLNVENKENVVFSYKFLLNNLNEECENFKKEFKNLRKQKYNKNFNNKKPSELFYIIKYNNNNN